MDQEEKKLINEEDEEGVLGVSVNLEKYGGTKHYDPRQLSEALNLISQQSSRSESELRLEENCARAGLTSHGETPSDGNCFFSAISDQLSILGLPPQTALELRESVVHFLRNNQSIEGPNGTVNLSKFNESSADWSAYCENMAKDGEWADALVVVATANMLQRDIFVVTSSPQNTGNIGSGYQWIVGAAYFTGQPLLLGHVWEQHYRSLQPQDSRRGGTGLTKEKNAGIYVTGGNNFSVIVQDGSNVTFDVNKLIEKLGKNVTDKKIRIVLIGRTGEGKSATANSIIGYKHFKEKAGFRSQTKNCQHTESVVQGEELLLIDTPGIFDTDDERQTTMNEIIRCLLLSSPGPHAFLLVIRIDRFTEEVQTSISILRKYFGDDALSHTIIIFTRRDELDAQGVTIEEAIREADIPLLNNLLERCGKRYIAFNNKARSKDNDDQVKKLLQMIEKMVAENGNKFYSSKVYKLIEAVLKEEEDKRRKQLIDARQPILESLDKEIKKLEQMIHEMESEKERLRKEGKTPSTEDAYTLQKAKEKLANAIEELQTQNATLVDENKKLRDNIRRDISRYGAPVTGLAVGAGIGAAVGNFLGPIGAVIGGAVGGIIGAIAGFFSR